MSDPLVTAVRACWLVILCGVIVVEAVRFLLHVRTLVTVVIGAVFFAYLIYPLIRRLSARMPLGAAIALVYVGFLVCAAAVLWAVVPLLVTQGQQLSVEAPALLGHARAALSDPHSALSRHLPPLVRAYLLSVPERITAALSRYSTEFATRVLPVLISFVSVAALFVMIPVVAAYLLLDAEALKRAVVLWIPPRGRPRAVVILQDLDRVVGGFIRGQLLVALTVGAMMTILLLILRVRYALLIGAFAGSLEIIPYIGAIAGWLPAFLIALFTNGFGNALLVTAGVIAINQLEGHIIAPNIIGRTVELPPLAIILALLAGGELAGIPGMMLAVPVAGMLRVLLRAFRPTVTAVSSSTTALDDVTAPTPPTRR